MSDAENRKSMDDVLASIRRIVRAEKSPAPEAEADDRPDAPVPERTPEAVPVNEPLALTPDMRLEPSPETSLPDAPVPTDIAPPPPPPAAMGAQNVMSAMDNEQIRNIIRDVVIEELRGPYGDEIVREIIRNELTAGEIGANISQNVIRLIQSEIAKRIS